MQTTLDRFALAGSSAATPPPPPAVLEYQLSVDVSRMSTTELERHKAALTMQPRDIGGFAPPEPFAVYREEGGRLYVPRFYGLARMPHPGGIEDRTRAGVPMQAPGFAGELKEVQRESHDATLAQLRAEGGAILVRKAGGGKTVLAIHLACALGVRTIVFCHTSALLDQWAARIRTFAPGATIGRIQQNKVDVEADFVLATIQSVTSRDYGAALFDKFGLGIVDEAHHIGGRTFFTAFEKLAPRYWLGLTATPDRADGLTCLLEYGLGRVAHRDPGHDVETVEVSVVRYTGGARKERVLRAGPKAGCANLPLMLNDLAADERRTELIAEHARALFAEGRKIIVLSERKALLDALCAAVQALGVPAERIAYFVGGATPREREAAAQRSLILATYQIAKEGLDIPQLDAAILATPIASVEQAVGRIQRPCATKMTPPKLIDIYDPFSVFVHKASARRRFYERKGFAVRTQP